MSETKKTSGQEEAKSKKPAKKKTLIYQDEQVAKINMPSTMITNKTAFLKIWKGAGVGTERLEKAWERAEKWKKSLK